MGSCLIVFCVFMTIEQTGRQRYRNGRCPTTLAYPGEDPGWAKRGFDMMRNRKPAANKVTKL